MVNIILWVQMMKKIVIMIGKIWIEHGKYYTTNLQAILVTWALK
jgi:hypothetical protein